MTTFTAQKLLYAIKTLSATESAIKTLGATESVSLAADNLGFSLSQGQFMVIFELFENPQTTDAQVFAFFKTLTDSSTAADAALISFATARTETTTTADEQILAVFKSLVDAATATESHVKSFSAARVDVATAADDQINHLNKHAVDIVNATDDVDAEASILDDQEMQFVKARTDTAVATESLVRQLNYNRTHADAASAIDLASLAPEKFFSDVGGVSDALLISRSKGLSSSAGATDTFVSQRAFSRSFTDTAYATDDFDGEASILDDQEMQFVKARTDIASVSDSIIVLKTIPLVLTETPSVTDAGSLRSQGFADFTYFAEDFVGASRTFT